ncbi:MAG: lysophospholipid acyltransferase family protein [Acidobacteria bacterium]|nr:lysophospholipid acyltransferase family protein [Acidobacteriota bacterium]
MRLPLWSDNILTWFIKALFLALRRLPFRAAVAAGRSAAWGVYLASGKHRRIARINLDIAFPDKSTAEKRRIARRSFQNLGEHLVLVARFPSLRKENQLHRLIHFAGAEHFQQAKEQNRPVLFLTAHLGFWELMAFCHGVVARRVHFIVRNLNQPGLDELLCRYRSLTGNVAIPKQNALRQVLRTLGRGEDVGILIDQNVQAKEGIFVDFFGKAASFTPGFALVALKSDAVILPSFMVHNPRGQARYTFHYLPEMPLEKTGDLETDIRRNTQRFARTLEEAVRRWPEHWLWGHRRWRTRPVDDPENPYAGV